MGQWCVIVIDMSTGSLSDHLTVDKSKSKYWIYLSHYPCHHDLPNYAEKEALTMLQLMVVRKQFQQFTEPYRYYFIS